MPAKWSGREAKPLAQGFFSFYEESFVPRGNQVMKSSFKYIGGANSNVQAPDLRKLLCPRPDSLIFAKRCWRVHIIVIDIKSIDFSTTTKNFSVHFFLIY
jgi:hypothetical protein